MRTMTIKRHRGDDHQLGDGRTLLPCAARLSALATGPVLLDGGVAGGRHGEVEPGDERLGPSGDGDLGHVTGECRGRDLCTGECARAGGGDELVGGLGARVRDEP